MGIPPPAIFEYQATVDHKGGALNKHTARPYFHAVSKNQSTLKGVK